MEIDKDNKLLIATDLRRQAEERLQSKTADQHPTRTMEETQRLVHELEVHQIELEMQNEALRQARDEVEKTLEKYTNLYDFAPTGYFTLDRNGAIRESNLSGAGLLEVERSRLIGRRFGQFVTDEYRTAFTAFLVTAFTSQCKETCEVALLNKANVPLVVQVEAMVSSSEQECRLAVIDISNLKQAEKGLKDKNIELEIYTSNVSHDLKSPLITIQGYVAQIRHDLKEGRQSRILRDLKIVDDESTKLAMLLDNLLELSRAGKMINMPAQVDMGLLVKGVLAQLAGPLKKKKVIVTVQSNLPRFYCDQQRISQVLQNLVENAIKYMGDQTSPCIEIGVRKKDKQYVFFVRDNGAGVEPLYQEKIFDLFNKIDAESNGSGIGLALVKRIIEVHGGRVWVESEGVGRGSNFYFALPG